MKFSFPKNKIFFIRKQPPTMLAKYYCGCNKININAPHHFSAILLLFIPWLSERAGKALAPLTVYSFALEKNKLRIEMGMTSLELLMHFLLHMIYMQANRW